MGSLGSTTSGPGIGGFYYNNLDVLPFSVTDWTNAVLVMDIYNPMDVNLSIFYCIIKDATKPSVLLFLKHYFVCKAAALPGKTALCSERQFFTVFFQI